MSRFHRSLPLLVAFLVAACGGAQPAPETGEGSSALDAEEPSTVDTMEEPAASEEAPEARHFADCREYSYTPTDCEGSAENPDCTSSFQLQPEGRAEGASDDIMMDGEYEVRGDQVSVRIGGFLDETFTLSADEQTLTHPSGATYTRSACP